MTLTTEKPHDRIFNILFREDELTWKSIILDLVNSEELNPWDVNISLIAQKFLDKLKELKDMDFRISGKVVLASAMLLQMKSSRLLDKDLTDFDALISASEEEAIEILEDFHEELEDHADNVPKIMPKTPQPRKRKVSVFDLIGALEQALEVQNRRKEYVTPKPKVKAPEKKRDISLIIKDLYGKITTYFSKQDKDLTFSKLIPSESKEDKVFTFIPLLHLDTQRKINLDQKEHFGEISILMNK